MMSMVIIAVALLFFSYLFISSGFQKARQQPYQQQVINQYRLLPQRWSPLLARWLPVIEISAGVALLIPGLRYLAMMLVVALLVVYSLAITINITRGRTDIDCGCSGSMNTQTISAWMLLRNSFLLIVALFLLSTDLVLALSWLEAVFVLLITTFIVLGYHLCNQLLANRDLIKRGIQHG